MASKANNSDSPDLSGNDDFWDTVAPMLGAGTLVEGTIMSSGCVRAGEEFVAMPHHRGPGMVVKLPRDRVSELIDDGVGQPFAPAKRVFKEWVLIEVFDEPQWSALLAESIAFVSK